jgi:hypothetical protein
MRAKAVHACVAGLLLTGGGSAQAQLVHRGADPWQPGSAPLTGPGFQASRVEYPIGCGASLRPCDTGPAASLAGSNASSLRWNVELSQLNLGSANRLAIGPARQGLNLSLVGRKPLFGSAFSVYGKLGGTYGYADPATSPAAALPASLETGYGVSFGAGVSMEVTPRLSATFGWDSHELRLGGGARDAFRATSLGLQYRY